MKIKINGIEINFNPVENNELPAQAPLLQQIMRDTSQNALRNEEIKKHFNDQFNPCKLELKK